MRRDCGAGFQPASSGGILPPVPIGRRRDGPHGGTRGRDAPRTGRQGCLPHTRGVGTRPRARNCDAPVRVAREDRLSQRRFRGSRSG